MSYLEEAAEQLRKASDANERDAGDRLLKTEVRERRLEIAAAFTRLAAIERGLSHDPSAVPARPDREAE
jgi:hypothetical protein